MLSKLPYFRMGLIKYSGNLIYWLYGNRYLDGMNIIWAFIRNRRILGTDVSLSLRLPLKDSLIDKGKKHKLRTSKAESTNAVFSCGLSRSSEEVPVMRMERRA